MEGGVHEVYVTVLLVPSYPFDMTLHLPTKIRGFYVYIHIHVCLSVCVCGGKCETKEPVGAEGGSRVN